MGKYRSLLRNWALIVLIVKARARFVHIARCSPQENPIVDPVLTGVPIELKKRRSFSSTL